MYLLKHSFHTPLAAHMCILIELLSNEGNWRPIWEPVEAPWWKWRQELGVWYVYLEKKRKQVMKIENKRAV